MNPVVRKWMRDGMQCWVDGVQERMGWGTREMDDCGAAFLGMGGEKITK
jgi:hypothetical protein